MSTASPARIEANRKNAEHSTGPRTLEGKAVSRSNSFKHGLTGAGIVVPGDDLARISAIGINLREEYAPTSEFGQAMADHAAVLIVRLNRAGQHELAMIDDQVSTAIYDFHEFRLGWADDLFNDLEVNPAGIDELRQFPEGVDRLIAEMTALATIDHWSADELDRAARLWPQHPRDARSLIAAIPGEIRKLEAARAVIDPTPMIRAREQASALALFSDSPVAILARKYEAATVRALDKAIKILEAGKLPKQVFLPPEPAQTPASDAALGSFLPVSTAPPERGVMPEVATVRVDPKPPVDRSKRPDPKKLREAQRRNRR